MCSALPFAQPIFEQFVALLVVGRERFRVVLEHSPDSSQVGLLQRRPQADLLGGLDRDHQHGLGLAEQ